jgi:acetyl esterase/lipase
LDYNTIFAPIQQNTVQWSAAALNAMARLTPVKQQSGIPYGQHARHRLDLFEPLFPRSVGQTIVFFYGGGWTSGSRLTYRFVGAALALRGFRVVIPDYRLHPEASIAEIMQDAAEAVTWIVTRYRETPLFLLGHSVGAHIAVTLAANPAGLPPQTTINGVIGLAGPYLPLGTPQSGDLPPALLIAAHNDRLVPATRTEQFATQWQKRGHVDVRLYRRGGHALLVGAFSPALRWAAPVLRDIMTFIRTRRAAMGSRAEAGASRRSAPRVKLPE